MIYTNPRAFAQNMDCPGMNSLVLDGAVAKGVGDTRLYVPYFQSLDGKEGSNCVSHDCATHRK